MFKLTSTVRTISINKQLAFFSSKNDVFSSNTCQFDKKQYFYNPVRTSLAILMQIKKKKKFLFQLQICGSSSARRKKNTLQENGSSAAILRYLSMTKFPWKLKYMAKYILKAFFLTTIPSTQKKYPKIYAVTLVLPLKAVFHHLKLWETVFNIHYSVLY